jgi:hypothetical protein
VWELPVRLAVLAVVVIAVSACGGTDGPQAETEPTTSAGAETSAETAETSGQDRGDVAPRSYDDVLASLPPLDVPASPEVEAYRRATIGSFFDRCVPGEGGANRPTFVRANTNLLDRLVEFPGTTLASEYSIDHRDFNGCLEGTGPPTSYSTYRAFRLPRRAAAQEVLRHYGRQLPDWTPAFAGGSCEQTFTKGDALLAVRACSGTLTLTARALPIVRPPPPPKPPPRPFGAQYPIAAGYTDLPDPTTYEVEPGETCERTSSASGGSIIVPPSPGIRAEVRDEPLRVGAGTFDRYVLVEWSFEKILGDCPPTRLHLTLVSPNAAMPPLSLPQDVRARSGTARLPVLDHFREVAVLRASAESLDGTRSRPVAVLIRR